MWLSSYWLPIKGESLSWRRGGRRPDFFSLIRNTASRELTWPWLTSVIPPLTNWSGRIPGVRSVSQGYREKVCFTKQYQKKISIGIEKEANIWNHLNLALPFRGVYSYLINEQVSSKKGCSYLNARYHEWNDSSANFVTGLAQSLVI